jgi:hypothetical protein
VRQLTSFPAALCRRRPLCLAALLAVGVLTPPVRANVIMPLEASVMIQSTAAEDVDYYLLTSFYGFKAGETLTYTSSINTVSNTWSGTLSGTYMGKAVSVSYSGDYSQYPSGKITWSSTGTYGSDSWTGSGNALFTEPTSTTFQIALNTSLQVGSNTGSVDNNLISGTIDANNYEYTDTTGSVTTNGTPQKNKIFWTQKFLRGKKKLFTDVELKSGRTIIVDNDSYTDDPLGGRTTERSSVTTMPEPNALAMSSLGFAMLSSYTWWRRRRRAA